MLGEGVQELGGLHVIGTERHESRRIDNQLKGRSGRQGDPGSSQFIISLEDDMIERFAHVERDRKLKSIKTDDNGQVLNKDLHKFIDTVQKISEGSNYNIREFTLKLDDVINDQRKVIYDLRDRVLREKNIIELVSPMVTDYLHTEIDRYCPETVVPENWPLEHLEEELQRGIPSVQESGLSEGSYENIEDLKEKLAPIVDRYLHQWKKFETNTALQTRWKQGAVLALDQLWVRHLEMMNRLKEGIGIRQYQQEDPIRLYEKDGLDIFQHNFNQIKKEMVILMAKLSRPAKKKAAKEAESDV